MARSLISSRRSKSRNDEEDKKDALTNLSALTAQRNAQVFFDKYDRREVQELLSLTTCNWLLCSDNFNIPVDFPPGIIKQMRNFTQSNMLILTPADPRVTLDYKVVQQIVKELTVGIYCFNQLPFISLEPNYEKSTSCQLTPAYYDTKVGQILINIDYTMKGLWHGAVIPADKRIRFSEIWRSCMDVDANGVPQTKKDMFSEFLTAGLMDPSQEPCYQGIYTQDCGADPTYEPNSPEEEQLFSQHAEGLLLKLTPCVSACQQHQNLFVFQSSCGLASAVRFPPDRLELPTYQRLQQRLALQEELVRDCLERKMETCQNLAYLRLIAFLVPLLVGLKKKMKIPDLSQVFEPFSDDKVKTERELPPLLLGPEFTCKHFPYKQDQYFHLHGGIEFDIGTSPLEDLAAEIQEAHATLQNLAADHLNDLRSQNAVYRQHFPVPVWEHEGKRYSVIAIDLEGLYAKANRIQWWEAMNSVIKALRGKRLPLTDIQLHEQFKKMFGYKKAIKCKSMPFGLKATAERGLSAAFHSLCRKTLPAHLSALDEHGYSLVHHAALRNHAPILCQLAAAGVILDQAHSNRFLRTGITALHLAAQCGSLEALNCLLALQANPRLADRRGWMAVHFAAYYGQIPCIRALCRVDPALIQTHTTARYRTTPLLLAASSGSLQALDFLLSVGADWRARDSEGNCVVHLAVLYFHTQLLQHLIQLGLDHLPVWALLVEMLESEKQKRREMAVRCMEVLCVTVDSFWKDIMNAGGVPALLGLLQSDWRVLQCCSAAVLCHMTQWAEPCEELVEWGAVPVLLGLLETRVPELHSRCAVILADLATRSPAFQELIARLGGVGPVVRLLSSDLQDVLVNAVRCVRALCVRSPGNQTALAQAGAIPPLVEFLTLKSEVLQEEVCSALADLALGHRQNQDAVCSAGAVGPLVLILRGRRLAAQVRAARALETIADHNPPVQARFLKKSAAKQLLRLLKVFQPEVKEQGAASLWVLAGQTQKQKRLMAEHIGYHFILEFLLSSSDKMQYVGCQAVIALTQDCRTHQDGLCAEKGVPPLVRLLRRSHTTPRTLLCVLQALRTLCIGVAHTRNLNSQKAISEEDAKLTLMKLLKYHKSLQVKVEVAQTLACLTLGNQELQAQLSDQMKFIYTEVLELLQAQDQTICLEAGYALSLFAYNNKVQQALILQSGGVSIATYEPFLQSESEAERAKAAFQIVVLANVITDVDQVTLSARGVTVMVNLLQSSHPDTVTLTAQLIASLAHTRAGISDGIITLGAVDHLCAHLCSEEEEVRISAACALGYLSFNRKAHRLLLVKCRNTPVIYDLLREHLIKDAKISNIFTADFRRQKLVGLPSLSLEANGGPPVCQHNKGVRCATSAGSRGRGLEKQWVRSQSAPILRTRGSVHTASPTVRLEVPELGASPSGARVGGVTNHSST
ncbi:ankyrin and armadillo repeat-containing protein [Conger conger]|uniref:ankyrin and armadillo repeat-containing protein n=1 Tax=Conger conger TaxID=82655 RepID=UPI002A599616|nr:ankyrin and armadillo repeat-containing protein [Conger conger]